jgi:uncharacterized phage protein (TIGR02220 family)
MGADMEYRINGFDQIKAFYSEVFNNIHDFTPQHISLYIFLINQNNRNNWVEWFKCPFDLGMAGSTIGNKKTYYKCLEDLKEWKYIDYKKGTNEWRSPQIKVEVLNRTATYTATVPQGTPLPIPLPTTLPTSQVGRDSNYKLLTSNLQPILDNIEKILVYVNSGCPDIKVEETVEETSPTYTDFLQLVNKYTKKAYRGDSKSKRQFAARTKESYTLADFETAISNLVKQRNHIESNFQYLTPEFFTRVDKLEYGINLAPQKVKQEKSKKHTNGLPDGFPYIEGVTDKYTPEHVAEILKSWGM